MVIEGLAAGTKRRESQTPMTSIFLCFLDETFKINMLVVTVICLVISVIINIIFICCQTQRRACQQCKERSSSHRGQNIVQKRDDIAEDGPDLNYAALHFSEGRTSRGKKKRDLMTEEIVYSQVKGPA
ncbi:hypothetical protein GOODEAATRI_007817 [Goodea atripinnis]|uniref:Uncharacterized protein n=1 Tax=Goodea atripinnis TaxID=208336 RepID=A0ABV0N8W4_9TELE